MVFCCSGLWYYGNIRDAYWTSFWEEELVRLLCLGCYMFAQAGILSLEPKCVSSDSLPSQFQSLLWKKQWESWKTQFERVDLKRELMGNSSAADSKRLSITSFAMVYLFFKGNRLPFPRTTLNHTPPPPHPTQALTGLLYLVYNIDIHPIQVWHLHV